MHDEFSEVKFFEDFGRQALSYVAAVCSRENDGRLCSTELQEVCSTAILKTYDHYVSAGFVAFDGFTLRERPAEALKVLLAYAVTCAQTEIKERWRRQRRVPPPRPLPQELRDPSPRQPFEQSERNERNRRVAIVLTAIRPSYAEVLELWLMRFPGNLKLSYFEISKLLRTTEDKIRARIYQALQAFKREWQRRYGNDPFI